MTEVRSRTSERVSQTRVVVASRTDELASLSEFVQFDHLRDKKANVGMMLHRTQNWEAIMAEIAKCEVVCANCHRVRTLRRGQHGERCA